MRTPLRFSPYSMKRSLSSGHYYDGSCGSDRHPFRKVYTRIFCWSQRPNEVPCEASIVSEDVLISVSRQQSSLGMGSCLHVLHDAIQFASRTKGRLWATGLKWSLIPWGWPASLCSLCLDILRRLGHLTSDAGESVVVKTPRPRRWLLCDRRWEITQDTYCRTQGAQRHPKSIRLREFNRPRFEHDCLPRGSGATSAGHKALQYYCFSVDSRSTREICFYLLVKLLTQTTYTD
jgi:hypothetical protein